MAVGLMYKFVYNLRSKPTGIFFSGNVTCICNTVYGLSAMIYVSFFLITYICNIVENRKLVYLTYISVGSLRIQH